MGILWTIFESRDLQNAQDVAEALSAARSRLRALDRLGVEAFRKEVKRAIETLDIPEFREQPVLLSNGDQLAQSADSFLYSRCACILSGRKAYEEAVIRRKFDRFLGVVLQGAEGVLYLADEIAKKETSSAEAGEPGFVQDSLGI